MTEFSGWRRSSWSSGNNDCVEVARDGDAVGVRDSKDPSGPVLVVSPAAFATFLADVRAGGL